MNNHTLSPFQLKPSWQKVLQEELQKPYMLKLAAFLEKERAQGVSVFPPRDLVFNAFLQTPFDKVKVVIVGQDPYHGSGQAHGLSFSVPHGVPIPPSLRNIYKELHDDIGFEIPNHGCLISWAKQGVLLLNATLTVRQKDPLSHHNVGWERFTDAVVEKIVKRDEPVIFVLWGNNAKKKIAQIEQDMEQKHVLLKAAHPSPFSAHRGFLGCRHFSQINEILKKWNRTPINWSLE